MFYPQLLIALIISMAGLAHASAANVDGSLCEEAASSLPFSAILLALLSTAISFYS